MVSIAAARPIHENSGDVQRIQVTLGCLGLNTTTCSNAGVGICVEVMTPIFWWFGPV